MAQVYRKMRSVYALKKAEVDAIADADLQDFTNYLAKAKPKLYQETVEASKKGAYPPRLTATVAAEYVKWSATRR